MFDATLLINIPFAANKSRSLARAFWSSFIDKSVKSQVI